MGNHSTKENAPPPFHQTEAATAPSGPTSPMERNHSPIYAARSGRGSRPDLSIFGIGSNAHNDVHERRETKQEREARKLEKERAARLRERQRSIREEYVDGGYLVTMGVYTGTEDFNKEVVRQLMIERRIAPFWRGLNDHREDWTEHQMVAVGRGLPISTQYDAPEEVQNPPSGAEEASRGNTQNLMVPISSRSHSAASNASTTLSPSHPAFSFPTPVAAASPPPMHASSPFRPRSKTLASLTTPSKVSASNDLMPREMQLSNDPLVNGQPIQVVLYKGAEECPICFLSYPPYLNKTRCCDQPICSECFVQIKRPDPHPPEHHDPPNSAVPLSETTSDDILVSEPACCPYCQQQEFGVTYEPPPFRRGLSYAAQGFGSYSSAMSSTSSLNSATNPPMVLHTHKRRTTSISANASTVITTDRIRPDWATKLANARSHLARRSAAATALHTAAYLIGNGTADNRSFIFSGRNRFGRNRGESSPATSGAVTPSSNLVEGNSRNVSEQLSTIRRDSHEAGGSRRRSRIDDLEDMMMMEAIRLSLAAEEERKRKADKDSSKDAKRRAKEERKQEKKERKGVYGSEASSASGSALSLSLPSLGRRRGNSGGSALGKAITLVPSERPKSKGKGIDRGVTSNPQQSPSGSAPIDFAPSTSSRSDRRIPRARHLDTSNFTSLSDIGQPSPSPTAPDKSSHLRHMSTASSPASSFVESIPGSLKNGFRGSSSTLDSANASGVNIASHVNGTPEVGDPGGSVGAEPMFNFRSLAAMIGHDEDDKEDAAKHVECLGDGKISKLKNDSPQTGSSSDLRDSAAVLPTDRCSVGAHVEGVRAQQETMVTLQEAAPEVKVIPETPAAAGHGEDNDKQRPAAWSGDVRQGITQ